MAPSSPAVLVANDETAVADTCARRLDDAYETRVARAEAGAPAAVDDTDAVLPDRRMPGLSGDDVLERLKGRGHDGARDDNRRRPGSEYPGNKLRGPPPQAGRPGDDPEDAGTAPRGPDTTDDRLEESFRAIPKLPVLGAEETGAGAGLEADQGFRRPEKRADRLATDRRERVDGFEHLAETHRSVGRGLP